jgi:hypothetical protein
MSLGAIRPQRGVKKLLARLRTYEIAQGMKWLASEMFCGLRRLLGGDRGCLLQWQARLNFVGQKRQGL